MDPIYYGAYALYFVSVLAIVVFTIRFSRAGSASVSPGRLLLLTKDELHRLRTGDPVFLMHLSIALGVALSIILVIADPILGLVPLFRPVLFLFSLPLVVGLLAAFAWRIQRYRASKEVERTLHVTSAFSSASTRLQAVLILAIALTTLELVLAWASVSLLWSEGLGVVRNSLVAFYYTLPTVNLVANFDMPLGTVSTPFMLEDVVSGKTDPSSIKVGVEKAGEFSPSKRLTFDSCVEIGACESACPATAAGRPLSPRILVRQVSLIPTQGVQEAPIGQTISEDELWSCTSCGACVASCPVGVKHLDLVYDLRRQLVAEGKLDREKSAMLENLAKTQNPYGLRQSSRGDWAEGLGVPTMAAGARPDYVYWVGCVSSFDQRAQAVAKAMAKILARAGISFAILGSEEGCNGDPARRLGEEGRYQELAYANIEKLNSYGVKKVIAACPHCFNALANEYPQFGGTFEVVYHTQLISDLIRDGKISVPKEKVQQVAVTLHDACYASRYNSVFEEPREALRASVSELREMGRRKEKTFCCGAGGSNYWYKVPQQRSIAGIRTEEARATGASMVATECPFCLSMLEDAAKVSGSGMGVRDVAEIVADCIA